MLFLTINNSNIDVCFKYLGIFLYFFSSYSLFTKLLQLKEEEKKRMETSATREKFTNRRQWR